MTPFPDPALLLAWYDRHKRTLPWRMPSGAADPYRVWLSEVMLQQTTVATVGPRYARFLARFPDVASLAAASWEEVAEEWAGLGYYARARNLHAGAKALAAGGFPTTVEGLRAMPGIGAYTAAAVAAIAFNRPVVPADGNVERVTARIHAVDAPLPAAKPRLAALAQGWMENPAARARPGDFAQALFDLGATVCTPRNPACAICPWRDGCAAQKAGIQAGLPRKAAKKARPTRFGVHFLLRDRDGRLLLRRRPDSGLLGGMLEVPGTPWREEGWGAAEAATHAPLPGMDWQPLNGEATHGFTHFELRMALWRAEAPGGLAPEGLAWWDAAAARAAMPTAMKRLLDLAGV
ncbi:A/G-specific adenine glycosylase [Falsiroseomonas stagni]|uniref:Adenine DNA glycosylase n=1 Tax=Falsiroseomonas stagni DSM 19981 TaxID=1123062 RepID=A0A1I3Y180_9PROT|nr:NUDIX domain-containing protein [Falsiroseomonas stagni]SFK25016.1 A/G-specific DNA-adenine glycosylase [Falsiroseomonas stagni DSM 19981]